MKWEHACMRVCFVSPDEGRDHHSSTQQLTSAITTFCVANLGRDGAGCRMPSEASTWRPTSAATVPPLVPRTAAASPATACHTAHGGHPGRHGCRVPTRAPTTHSPIHPSHRPHLPSYWMVLLHLTTLLGHKRHSAAVMAAEGDSSRRGSRARPRHSPTAGPAAAAAAARPCPAAGAAGRDTM